MSSEPAKPREKQTALLLGLVFLPFVVMLLALDFVPEWWAHQTYVEGRCVVLDKRIVEDASGKGGNSTYRPELLIRYSVAGREYQTWAYRAVHSSSALRGPKESVLESFTIGQEYPCWYDPADPSRVLVVRGYSCLSYGLLVVLPVQVFLISRGIVRYRRNSQRATGKAHGEHNR